MKRRYRILGGALAVLALAVASLAIAVSHNSACTAPNPPPDGAERMRAIVKHCYGSTEVLAAEEVAKPTPEEHQVLVKVHAAALNPLDWYGMTGTPYVARASNGFGAPKDARMGVDFAGTVEAVGPSVTRFKPGDEVFGGRNGALAEYVTVREDRAIVRKPENLTFEEAASVPVAAVTALQALRDHGRLRPGEKVLINGASGGVGTFAVQIARSLGAEVSGVCSTRNVDLVRSLGADHVFDYKQEDFTLSGQRYDLIIDNVGNRSWSDIKRVLNEDSRYIVVGGPKSDPWIGPLVAVIKPTLLSPFVRQEVKFFIAQLNATDLEFLGELMRAGKVTPVIDRQYPLGEIRAAMEYLGQGHARGKIVINLE